MPKFINDIVLDLGLNYIKGAATNFIPCIGAPVSYSEATTNYPTGKRCGTTIVNAANFTGPIDAASGRKLITSSITGITVDVSGTVDHVAIVDTVSANLLAVVSLASSLAVTSCNTMSIATFDINIQDPV